MSEDQDNLTRFLRALLPRAMADDLLAHAQDDPEWAADMARKYLEADEGARADMLAFHESDGPRMADEAHRKDVDGTPTSADLEEWL